MKFEYLIILLFGHVSPQHALNCNGCRALLQVAFPFQPHADIALDGDGCPRLSQKVNIPEENKHQLKHSFDELINR